MLSIIYALLVMGGRENAKSKIRENGLLENKKTKSPKGLQKGDNKGMLHRARKKPNQKKQSLGEHTRLG